MTPTTEDAPTTGTDRAVQKRARPRTERRKPGSADATGTADATGAPHESAWAAQNELEWLRADLSNRLWDALPGNYEALSVDLRKKVQDDDPRVRELRAKVKVAAERVAAMQEKVGGRVFRVPEENLERLTKRVAKLNKRATKLGVTPVGLALTEERFDKKLKRGRSKMVVPYRFVVISGDTPKYGGWRFAATLDRDAAQGGEDEMGVAIRRVPPMGDEKDSFIEGLDLEKYRFSPNACDQCQKNRRRKNIYVVANEDSGETKQVGTECVKDFLGGADPKHLGLVAEFLIDLDGQLGDEDGEVGDGGSGLGSSASRPSIDTFLAHVITMTREYGFTTKGQAYDSGGTKRATADQALDNLFNMIARIKDRQGSPLWREPTDEDYDKAKEVIAWVKDNVVTKERKNDFEHNVSVYVQQESLGRKAEGIIAYLPTMMQRDGERFVKAQVDAKAKESLADRLHKSEFVGEPGKRQSFKKLTVMRVGSYEGNYGVTYPTTFQDEDGNQFLWWASREVADVGEILDMDAMVKKHDVDRKFGHKVTVITRGTKLNVVGRVTEEALEALSADALED